MPRGPASGTWFASAAICYRMLAADLLSSAERGAVLSDWTCARPFPSGSGSGGGKTAGIRWR
jgi:hypothetical protein